MLRSRSCVRSLLTTSQRVNALKTSSLSIRLASTLPYGDVTPISRINLHPVLTKQELVASAFGVLEEILKEQTVLKLDDKAKPAEDLGKTEEQPPKEEKKKRNKKEPPTKIEEPTKSTTGSSAVKAESGASAASSSGDSGFKGDSDDGSVKSGDDKIAKVREIYPQVLAVPLTKRPLFPGMYSVIEVNNPQVIRAIDRLLDENKPYIGVFAFKSESADGDIINHKNEIFDTGVFAQITKAQTKKRVDGASFMSVVLYPHFRIRADEVIPPKQLGEIITDETSQKENLEKKVEQELNDEGKSMEESAIQTKEEERLIRKLDEEAESNPTGFLSEYEVSRVNITLLKSEPFDKKAANINALSNIILGDLKEIGTKNQILKTQLLAINARDNGAAFDKPDALADFTTALCAGELDEIQAVLSELNVEKRLEKACELLKKEIMVDNLLHEINNKVETTINESHRKYKLMTQLEVIKKELKIDDVAQKHIEAVDEKLKNKVIPDNVQKIIDEEKAKLLIAQPQSTEFGFIKNYLDAVSRLPFGQFTKETFNILSARNVLNEDHYGLKDVKDRILEFIAISKLQGSVKGKILCFVGPPGVGKTSIGKSIARALNRNFFRFSVGGLSDTADIKGFRKTYVGALPGFCIKALQETNSMNPLILIDEIDKINNFAGHKGDPAAALLELLDPEQNIEFLDHYLDFSVDFSNALFVCTANTLDTISRPLLDRMEIIEIPGYVLDEKVQIAKNYLIPSAKIQSGLSHTKVEIADDTIESIVNQYSRENGIRGLKQLIGRVHGKIAHKAVLEYEGKDDSKIEKEVEPNVDHRDPKTKETVKKEDIPMNNVSLPESFELKVTPENLKDFLGSPVFTSYRLYEVTPPGVVMGLAVDPVAGSSLYIESACEASDKGGHIHVTGRLGETMKESSDISFVIAKRYVKNDFFKKHNIFVHCPEGAIKKDGPSAGVSMTTSLISLALNKPLPPIAMTGEITLTGKVLKIGGLKEKLIAAQGNGIRKVYIPKENKNQYDDLDEKLKEAIDVTLIDNYSELFDALFSDCPNEPVVEASKSH